MELKAFTDYSLRVLMYLGLGSERLASIDEIAQAYRISRNHLTKVVNSLAHGGFILTFRGQHGGIKLARQPGQINLGEVVRHCEGTPVPAECFRPDHGTCLITGSCALSAILEEACDNFLATLDQYTLADLLDRPRRLRCALRLKGYRRRETRSRPDARIESA